MDEKKKQAFLQATGKLIQNKISEKDIIISLKEMGLEGEEAKQILKEAKKQPKKETLPEKKVDAAKGSAKGATGGSPATERSTREGGRATEGSAGEGAGGKPIKKPAVVPEKTIPKLKKTEPAPFMLPKKEEIKTETSPKTGKKKGLAFWKNILEKKAQETPQEKTGKTKTFIPTLKKGGKTKVKEIIEESPLEKKKEKPEKEEKSNLDKIAEEKPKKEIGIPKKEPLMAEKPMLATEGGPGGEEKPLQEEKPMKKEIVGGLTGFSFKSSLDLIGKKVEKGKNVEQATKEIRIEKKIQNETEKISQITILIIPNKEYSQGMSVLLKKLDKSYKKIVLVNLNELYKSLIQHMKNLGVGVDKFFIVDAITLTSDKTTTKHDNCIFVSSPNSLIELSLGITQALNTIKPDVLVFDSLSTLLIYEKDSTVTKFVHSLIGKIKAAGLDAYFTALEGDSQNESVKDLSMFVDKVNTLTEFELGEMGFPVRDQPDRMQELSINTREMAKPIRKEITQNLGENKIVTQEMNILKQRLNEMQGNREVEKSLNEIKGKMGKIDELKNLQEQVKLISEKIEEKQEKPIDMKLIGQITKLEEKIDSAQKKRGKKEHEKYNKELKKAMKGLKDKIEKIEKLSSLQNQVKTLSEKIEKKKVKPVDNRMVEQITKLTDKIDSLEKKVSKKLKEKKKKKKTKEHENLKKKLDSYKKQLELQSMMNDFYKTDVSKINPDNVVTKQLSHSLEKKKDFLEKAYKKGLVPKKIYSKGTKRINQETKRLQHAAQIHSLEQKLDALNEAYDSGIISRDSYQKGKNRLERLLKK